MKGSLRGSFHGNRNSFRGGSIRGRRGSKRGSFRVPKPGMSPGGKVPPSNLMKPKVETRLDISLFYQVYIQYTYMYIHVHTSCTKRLLWKVCCVMWRGVAWRGVVVWCVVLCCVVLCCVVLCGVFVALSIKQLLGWNGQCPMSLSAK